jgi:hypothetical protein
MVCKTFFQAAGSVISSLLQPRRERPGTPLRSLCIAAFDFAAKVNGQRLTLEKRRVLSRMLDLGALINDHFDQRRFDNHTYRRLRKQITADATVRPAFLAYFREMRRVERNRPRLRLPCRPGVLREVARYREQVVRLSLSALAAIALGRPDSAGVHDARQPAAEDACLSYLFPLVMLLQVCDDLLDCRTDWRARLPSFVTAALLQSEQPTPGCVADPGELRTNIQTAANDYLATMPKRRCAFWPFALCTHAVLFFVKPLCMFASWTMQRGNRSTMPRLKFFRPILAAKPPESRQNAISLED